MIFLVGLAIGIVIFSLYMTFAKKESFEFTEAGYNLEPSNGNPVHVQEQSTPLLDPPCHNNSFSCSGASRCSKNVESIENYHIADPIDPDLGCGYFSSTLNSQHPSGFHTHGYTRNHFQGDYIPKSRDGYGILNLKKNPLNEGRV